MCTTFTYVFLEMNEKDLSSTIENRIKSITKQTFFRIIWWNSMLLFFFLGKFCHSFTWTNSAREHSTKQGLHAYFGLDRINILYLNVFPGIEVSHLFGLAIYPFVCFFFHFVLFIMVVSSIHAFVSAIGVFLHKWNQLFVIFWSFFSLHFCEIFSCKYGWKVLFAMIVM